jgi:hypothetical protein
MHAKSSAKIVQRLDLSVACSTVHPSHQLFPQLSEMKSINFSLLSGLKMIMIVGR